MNTKKLKIAQARSNHKSSQLTRHNYKKGFGLEYVIQNEIECYKEKNCIDSFLNHPFKQCDWSDRKLKRSTPYICLARKAWQIEKLIDNNSNARRIQFPTCLENQNYKFFPLSDPFCLFFWPRWGGIVRGVGCEDSGGSGRHYVRGEHLPSSSQEKRINSGPEREYYTYSDKNPPTLTTHFAVIVWGGTIFHFYLQQEKHARTNFCKVQFTVLTIWRSIPGSFGRHF